MAGMIVVSPSGLVKKLVGESLQIQIRFPQEIQYEVQVKANFNGQDKRYTAEPVNEGYLIDIPLIKSGFYWWSLRFRRKGTKRWHQYQDREGNLHINQVQVDPAWVAQAIVYNVFVRFFKGKQTETATQTNFKLPHAAGMGTFDDVKAHLDELRRLKVNVLFLNPIHQVGEIHKGYNLIDDLPSYLQPGSPYSVKDYKSIDPELTFDKDTHKFALADPHQEFKDLVEAAHERGMFVFMDMVFNHTAHDFVLQRMKPEWYLYKENITSLTDPYIYPDEVKDGKPWGDPHHSLSPYDHGIWWSDCAQLNWEYYLPSGPNEPPPNYSIKDMWAYFESIPQYWIKHFGIDGFRCDSAYRIPPAFWKRCIHEARQSARNFNTNLSHDVVFIAESYNDDLKALQEAGFTAVYGDYSHKLINPLTLKGYLDYAYNLSGDFFPSGSRWFHFPESHDFSRTPEKILGNSAAVNPTAAIQVNKSRWLLTATLPGIPLIFNGFEQIEWRPLKIASYGAVIWKNLPELQSFIATINDIRHHSPVLQKGTYKYLPTNQPLNDQAQVFAFVREFNHEQLIVVVNMDVHHQAGPTIVYLPEEFDGNYNLTDLLSNQNFNRQGRELVVVLPPGEGHVFKVRLMPSP